MVDSVLKNRCFAGISEIKAVCFDFGDTLVRYKPSREVLFRRAAAHVGVGLSDKAVKRAYDIVDSAVSYSSVRLKSRSERERYYCDFNRRLCLVLGIESEFKNIYESVKMTFRERGCWQLAPGVRYALNLISQAGVEMALIANWDKSLEMLVASLGIREYFRVLISSEQAGVDKPSAKIFKIALMSLGLEDDASEVVYVGNDYRADIVGARTAGLIPVLLDEQGKYPHADCPRVANLRQAAILLTGFK